MFSYLKAFQPQKICGPFTCYTEVEADFAIGHYSDVARFAGDGLLLVMPEGASSYYTNAVDPPQDRCEGYVVHDLVADVESRFPVFVGRSNRALVGLSMGGFGSIKIGLRHPELFLFVGGLSSAIDVPLRPSRLRGLSNPGTSPRFSAQPDRRLVATTIPSL